MARRFIAVTFSTLSFLAFAPAAALADQAPPAPSPSLQSILISLPASFTAPVNSPIVGKFGPNAYASTWGTNSGQALNEIELDGFVDGYGLAKADTKAARIMVEFVMAFSGQKGALRFARSDDVQNKSHPQYQHEDPISGVGQYSFGVHLVQASPLVVIDGFEFVKGNDLFGVGVYSTKDDVTGLQIAQAQSRAEYDAAPFQTIPSYDWPENVAASTSSQGFSLGSGPEVFIVLGVIAALLAVGAFLWMRRGEMQPEKPKVAQQMTADGQYWFNGTYWIATSEMAPPWAQRSKDGAFWWDGRAWQAVPRPQVPAGR